MANGAGALTGTTESLALLVKALYIDDFFGVKDILTDDKYFHNMGDIYEC